LIINHQNNIGVSVIIPTHNRSSLLKRAVRSVLKQTYTYFECIIVDDASSDGTQEVVNSFKDDRLVYLRNKDNRGASASRNKGIKKSQGEFIAFLDDDDEWLDEKLEKQVNLLENLPSEYGMVYCWMDYFDKDGKLFYENHQTLKGYVFPHVLDAQRLGGCPTLLVRRNIINEIGGFDESLLRGNDGDFIRRVCRKYEVDYVPEVLVKVYFEHGYERISDQKKENIKNAIKGQKTKLKKFSNELNDFPEKKSKIYVDLGNHYDELRQLNSAMRFYFKAIIASPRNKNIYKLLFFKMISFSMYR
jgi:glycosyltransferase involved in cell wall biosynthesis